MVDASLESVAGADPIPDTCPGRTEELQASPIVPKLSPAEAVTFRSDKSMPWSQMAVGFNSLVVRLWTSYVTSLNLSENKGNNNNNTSLTKSWKYQK